MQINRENYEIYFIDYIDGKLTPSDEEIFRDFLKSNPDLAKELEGLEMATLVPDEIRFSSKKSLHKSESYHGIENKLDYLCIAKLEGDLSPNEAKDLEGIVEKSDSAKKNLSIFFQTRLIPDKQLIYKNKLKLKRFTIFQMSYRAFLSAGSVAAMALLVLGIFTTIKQTADFVGDEVVVVLEPVKEQIDENMATANIEESEKEAFAIIEKPIKIIETPYQEVEQKVVSIVQVDNAPKNFEVGLEMIGTINLTRFPEPEMQYSNIILLALIQDDIPKMQDNPSDAIGVRTSSRQIGLFELAQMGFSRLSNYTGRDINLDAEKDQDGNIRKINFETDLFALSVPVKKRN